MNFIIGFELQYAILLYPIKPVYVSIAIKASAQEIMIYEKLRRLCFFY